MERIGATHIVSCFPTLLYTPCRTVYDVTRRETLDAIGRYWLPEAERNGTYPDAVKMIMANKIDMVGTRACGEDLPLSLVCKQFVRQHVA